MKDFTKMIVYGGIFFIPTIVLIISNSLFFPFITGKNFTFRVVTEIIFAAWIILACYEPQYRLRFSWILGLFGTFLGVMFFANLLGEHPLQSFWNNFERMEGYVTLVHTFMYFVVVGSVLKTEKVWDRYFNMTITVAVILSLYAFAQLSGNITINQGGWRLDGTLGNSAYMAVYMLFHVFITLYMCLRTKSKNARYVYGALTLLFVYLLIQTATRGTAVGLFGGLFVGVSYMALFAKDYPRVRKTAITGILALVVLVGTFITFKESSFVQQNPYLERIASISFKELTTRMNIWTMAFEGVKERPILGWGQSNYNYVFNKYYEPELHGQEAWFDRVHNIVMDWLIAGGFVGVLAYFALFFSAVYYVAIRPMIVKGDSAFTVVERGILLGLLAGYLVHNTLVFDNIVSYIFYGMMLAYIHARVSTPIVRLEKKRLDTRVIEQVTAPVVAVLLCITVYFVNVPGIQAAGDIIDAFRTQNPDEMLAAFDRALARDSFGNQEVREQLTQRVQSLIQNPEVPEEIKEKARKRVEEELLRQIEEKPGDARVEMFISSYYRMSGQAEKAIEHLATARELSPRKQLIIYEQGFAAIQNGQYEEAMQFFKEAYELAPRFAESRSFYAMAALYNNKPEIVAEVIQDDEQKNTFAMNDYAVQAAYKMKLYPLLIEMLQTRVKNKPGDVQERTSLAFVYNESGDIQKAVEVLTQAGKDIPEFKTQSDQFIEGLYREKLNVGKPTTTPVR